MSFTITATRRILWGDPLPPIDAAAEALLERSRPDLGAGFEERHLGAAAWAPARSPCSSAAASPRPSMSLRGRGARQAGSQPQQSGAPAQASGEAPRAPEPVRSFKVKQEAALPAGDAAPSGTPDREGPSPERAGGEPQRRPSGVVSSSPPAPAAAAASVVGGSPPSAGGPAQAPGRPGSLGVDANGDRGAAAGSPRSTDAGAWTGYGYDADAGSPTTNGGPATAPWSDDSSRNPHMYPRDDSGEGSWAGGAAGGAPGALQQPPAEDEDWFDSGEGPPSLRQQRRGRFSIGGQRHPAALPRTFTKASIK